MNNDKEKYITSNEEPPTKRARLLGEQESEVTSSNWNKDDTSDGLSDISDDEDTSTSNSSTSSEDSDSSDSSSEDSVENVSNYKSIKSTRDNVSNNKSIKSTRDNVSNNTSSIALEENISNDRFCIASVENVSNNRSSKALEEENVVNDRSCKALKENISNNRSCKASQEENISNDKLCKALEENVSKNRSSKALEENVSNNRSNKALEENVSNSRSSKTMQEKNVSNERLRKASKGIISNDRSVSKAFGGIECPAMLEGLDLLDEVKAENDDDVNEKPGEDTDEENSTIYESDVPEEEIDALLEEGLPEEMKGPRKAKKPDNEVSEIQFERKETVVLAEREVNHFEVLPEGWVEITHHCGMPVYLHRETRVCTFSKPYFLGPGSARKHSVPLSSIPCLQYEKMKEKQKERERKLDEEKQKLLEQLEKEKTTETAKENTQQGLTGPLAKALAQQTGLQLSEDTPTVPTAGILLKAGVAEIAEARVESSLEVQKGDYLEAKSLMDYCQRRFKFKTIKLLRFKSWADKRRYEKKHKRDMPRLPDSTNLISLRTREFSENYNPKKEWVINPKNKSYVCILHEYVQHVLKSQPKYIFKEVENAATPYAATLVISGMHYSTGYGSSKRTAKMEAAKTTLEILLPELGKKIREEKGIENDTDLSFFDEIKIEDSRVPDLCNKASEMSPYSVLLNCMQRNFGLSSKGIESKLITLNNQKNEFMMQVGKHKVIVQCKNKKDGKHKASQALLQKLHPHITSWGSLLRLYGNKSLQLMKEKKAEEQEITLLQANATLHQPNTSIIKKLKEEMLKLKMHKDVIQPIGKFLPPNDISLPSTQGTELNNVDL